MTHLIIHAGFHKTGTTSVQTMAARNAKLLAPHARIYLRDDFRAVTDAARAYSVSHRADALDAVFNAARAFLRKLDGNDPRPIALLSEDLSGHLPGRHNIRSYCAAPALMAQLAAACVERFGEKAQVTFHFSTRLPEPWFRSAYWQILRSARRVEGPEEFAKLFEQAADFDSVTQAVAEAVDPFPVQIATLEDLTDMPQGPMTPILDWLNIPDDICARLDPGPPANSKPQGLDDVFLALNRTGLPDGKVASLKKTILRMARRIEAKREDERIG